jgi:catechol 2,3-dioxygenase-like lactoylglutathione lyase family enzyme
LDTPVILVGVEAAAVDVATWSHSSLAVRDLDRAVAFYRDAFGFELVFEARALAGLIASIVGSPGLDCDLAQLRHSRSRHVLELIAFRSPEAAVDARPPVGHVAFTVADVDPALAAVSALGARPVGEVTRFPEGRSVYCREPGGSVFELSDELR